MGSRCQDSASAGHPLLLLLLRQAPRVHRTPPPQLQQLLQTSSRQGLKQPQQQQLEKLTQQLQGQRQTMQRRCLSLGNSTRETGAAAGGQHLLARAWVAVV